MPCHTRRRDWLIAQSYTTHLEHAAEASMAIPTAPVLFIKPRTSLTGPGEIPISKLAQDQLDYETELACVFSADAKDVTEEDALKYVLGLVRSAAAFHLLVSQWGCCQLHRFKRCFRSQVSIGDIAVVSLSYIAETPKSTLPPTCRCFGKGFDNFCPIGPVLVRTSELDPDKVQLKGTLSGEVMQDENTS